MKVTLNVHLILLLLFSFSVNIMMVSAINVQADNKLNTLQEQSHSYFKRDNTCRQNRPFVWCLPFDYDTEVAPWKYRHINNATLPWEYHFDFYVFEIQERKGREILYTRLFHSF